MIRVSLILVDFLARLASAPEFHLSIEPGATMAEAVAMLGERAGPDLCRAVFDASGRPQPYFVISLDGTRIPGNRLGETPVHDQAVIRIIPLADGG
ncbi:MAG: hypothetical protein KKB20_23285 [Proteobacteria bacterium]|nr:hypothetical protein [Pseudomonadota bacterium]